MKVSDFVEEAKSFRDYEKAVGADQAAPVGEHGATIERAEVRERNGLPSLFVLLRIRSGDHKGETIPQTLGWFVADSKPDGTAKTEAEMARGTRFVRSQTNRFLRAVFGNDLSQWPETIEIASADEADDPEAMERIMATWEAVEGLPVTVTVKDRKDSDYQNFSYKQFVDIEEFSFA